MGYSSLQDCVRDLEANGELRRIDIELDAHLELGEVQRRVFAAGGPALLFTRVKGCRFPMLGNLFGTKKRVEFIFRDALEHVRRVIELKIDPMAALKNPFRYWAAPITALTMLPKSVSRGPVMEETCRVSELPQLVSWPDDAGGFVTLPQVYSEDPRQAGWKHANLGMYRVQLSGNQYVADQEIGLHYQLHRGIGVHHAAAIEQNKPLPVSIMIGGPPAMTLAAVMPLPEGLSELVFAGALNRRRVRIVRGIGPVPFHGEADFVITGTIDPTRTKPEGPFGDHLGYYAKQEEFPVMKVERVWHRRDAIWPFTVVGRPPQEDTMFGEIIHELTGPIIPTVLPGIRGVHAVDAAGVHPLLLAIGSERYAPYSKSRKPRELLTQASAILGQGQLSLAKYLFIVAEQDDPQLDVHDIPGLIQHLLQRVDWTTDCHFHTRTTIDTLDYTGTGLNEGSKLVIPAAGPMRRELPTTLPSDLHLPSDCGLSNPRVAMPGVLLLQGRRWSATAREQDQLVEQFCAGLPVTHPLNQFPLVIVVDDSEFAARTLNNWLWVTFTRSNPANDIYGVASFTEQKHWGCRGSLVIDARIKPWHAPPLIEDPAVTRRIDELSRSGGPLAGLWS